MNALNRPAATASVSSLRTGLCGGALLSVCAMAITFSPVASSDDTLRGPNGYGPAPAQATQQWVEEMSEAKSRGLGEFGQNTRDSAREALEAQQVRARSEALIGNQPQLRTEETLRSQELNAGDVARDRHQRWQEAVRNLSMEE